MSIQEQITRINTAVHNDPAAGDHTAPRGIVQTLESWGLLGGIQYPHVDDAALALSNIDLQTVPKSITQNGTFTLGTAGYYPAGYQIIVNTGGSAEYQLQDKTLTAAQAFTRDGVTVTADSSPTAYYGLSSVTIPALPTKYQDVSQVTATAGDILANKTIMTEFGLVTGTMPNNGTVTTQTLTTGTTSYTIPQGYHSGSGKVQIVTEDKGTITPTTSNQVITPGTNKVISRITVAGDADLTAGNIKKGVEIFGVSGTFTDSSTVSSGQVAATANKIYAGSSAWVDGTEVKGSMADLPTDDSGGIVSYGVTSSDNKVAFSISGTPNSIYAVALPQRTTPTSALLGETTVSVTLVTSEDVKSSSNLTVSGNTVTVPAGYYASNASASISAGALATPTVSSGGLVTAGVSSAGYLTTSATKTLQLSTQAAKTVTPSTSTQTAVAAGKYTTGDVTVAAIPSNFVNSSTVTATAANVLEDTYAVVKTGTNIWAVAEGTIVNRGTCSGTIDGLTTGSYMISAGYYSGGSVTLTNGIENALAAI